MNAKRSWLAKFALRSLVAMVATGLLVTPAIAKVKKQIDAVSTIKNKTGDKVQGIRITLTRPGGLTVNDVTPITAGTPWMTFTKVPGANANTVIISFKGGEVDKDKDGKVKFTVKGDAQTVVAQSIWTDGSNPIPGPKMPPIPSDDLVADPMYTPSYLLEPELSHPADSILRIDDLQFMNNVPGVSLGSLEYDPLGIGYDSPRSPFDISLGGDGPTFNTGPEPLAFNYVYAQGLLLDPTTGEQIGSYVHGFQVVPEPGTTAMVSLGCVLILVLRRRRGDAAVLYSAGSLGC